MNQENTYTNSVALKTYHLGELLGIIDNANIELIIPEYQRTYCWEEKHVFRLLKDLNKRCHSTYHLGTIILHKQNNNQYDIVDGQQRLVTLSLILLALNNEANFKFLDQPFESAQAESYVAYNKYLINNFLNKPNKIQYELLIKNICFSVLILNNANLDLAYTFFTSENGKGKSLTDYDLLKSHHLRYVHIAEQAEHLADKWDDAIRTSNNNDSTKPLARTLGIHLFRLRKWMRKRNWDEDEKRKVKNHFEAAPIIPYIAPFGEQFEYYETIQGGTHFFEYSHHFVQRFEEFTELEIFKQLYLHLSWEKHWWYRDATETLLFAYFLKFGQQYISEASVKIIDYLSFHRYENSRVYMSSILNYVNQSEIVMMIDQATSPTFFLAELQIKIDLLPEVKPEPGTRERFFNNVNAIKQNLKIAIPT